MKYILSCARKNFVNFKPFVPLHKIKGPCLQSYRLCLRQPTGQPRPLPVTVTVWQEHRSLWREGPPASRIGAGPLLLPSRDFSPCCYSLPCPILCPALCRAFLHSDLWTSPIFEEKPPSADPTSASCLSILLGPFHSQALWAALCSLPHVPGQASSCPLGPAPTLRRHHSRQDHQWPPCYQTRGSHSAFSTPRTPAVPMLLPALTPGLLGPRTLLCCFLTILGVSS